MEVATTPPVDCGTARTIAIDVASSLRAQGWKILTGAARQQDDIPRHALDARFHT
jgi:hypothetical protein